MKTQSILVRTLTAESAVGNLLARIGEESERKGTAALTDKQIDRIVQGTRKEEKKT